MNAMIGDFLETRASGRFSVDEFLPRFWVSQESFRVKSSISLVIRVWNYTHETFLRRSSDPRCPDSTEMIWRSRRQSILIGCSISRTTSPDRESRQPKSTQQNQCHPIKSFQNQLMPLHSMPIWTGKPSHLHRIRHLLRSEQQILQ